MLSFFAESERNALAPLLQLARARHGADRRLWLDELRRDAPAIVRRLEAILSQEVEASVVALPTARPSGLAVAPRAASIVTDAWTTSAA